MQSKKPKFIEPVKQLLRDGKIKILLQTGTLGYLIAQRKDELTKGVKGTAAPNFVDFVEDLIQQYLRTPLSGDIIRQVRTQVNGWTPVSGTITDTIRGAIAELTSALDIFEQALEMNSRFKPRFVTSLDSIIGELNDATKKSIYIIQGGNDADVRFISHSLGDRMLERRRETGSIFPLVSFVYDEADQFIPQVQQADQPGMLQSRGTAEQLARRGRKYGLGIGIATQRIVYLDTNVLGQPHTYFVSKLPRESDRERIQQAFGLSDETLRESLRFRVGQWLLISHSATGVDGLPIPVTLPDANERIIKFLESFKSK